MSLQDEIENGSKEIATDGYPMSIGELISVYRDGDLDLHPEFQREFRWKLTQKSRLIESILLGIPVPNIFVFQRTDGVWDVIDGLQRLSTILEFAGELRDENHNLLPAIALSKTRYLPSLDSKYWETPDDNNSLTDAQRRLLKRAKLDIKIIKNDTSQTSKFEMFDRLNTGGTLATDQEVRNCLLIMANRPLYLWLKTLAADPNFKECTALSERQLEEKYDFELVLRFLIFLALNDDELAFEEIGKFLTERMLAFASGEVQLNRETAEAAFRKTFQILVGSELVEDAFRKFDWNKNKFVGAFSISSYEAVSLGLGQRFFLDPRASAPQNLTDIIKQLWRDQVFLDNSGSGVRANSRIQRTVPLGRARLAGA